MDKRPSESEVEDQLNKDIEQIESEQKDPSIKPFEDKEESTETEEKPTEPTDEKEVVEEEPKEETKEEPEEIKEKPQTDYKKKWVESSREGLILHEKNKKLNESVDQAFNLPEPTEEEMQKEYSDWDILDDFQKKLAKQSFDANRKLKMIHESTLVEKTAQKWNEEVDKYLEEPATLTTTPELAGKEEEFKLFATRPSRRGVSFETLVSAFLHDFEKENPPKRGQMFEKGTSTVDKNPKDDKISLEEAEKIRTTDYKKYKELLMADKIADL